MRALSIILMLMFANTVHAQTSSLSFEYSPNKYVKRELEKNGLILLVFKRTGFGDIKKLFDTTLIGDTKKIMIDSLPADSVAIQIFARISLDGKGASVSYNLGTLVIDNIVLEAGKTKAVKVKYPADCNYYKDINNETCPRCHKKDMTKRLMWGMTIIDPLTGEIYDQGGKVVPTGNCEPTNCEPSWYCTRDKYAY